MNVVDKKDGKWYVNTGEYGIPDYERQAANPGEPIVILEPGVQTLIKASGYLLGQPTIKRCANPMTGDAPDDEEVVETAETEKTPEPAKTAKK